MTTAEAMPERFYVPLNIDFRGRIYPIPHFNFTRDDRVRGLFLFADGKPIGEEGLLWLKAHVAARADGVAWSDHTGPRLSELDFDRACGLDGREQRTVAQDRQVSIRWRRPGDIGLGIEGARQG